MYQQTEGIWQRRPELVPHPSTTGFGVTDQASFVICPFWAPKLVEPKFIPGYKIFDHAHGSPGPI